VVTAVSSFVTAKQKEDHKRHKKHKKDRYIISCACEWPIPNELSCSL